MQGTLFEDPKCEEKTWRLDSRDMPPSGALIHDKIGFWPLNNLMKWNLFDVKIYWRKHK